MSESETTNPGGINTWLKKKAAVGAASAVATGQPLEIDLDLLDPNPKQPRHEWDVDALNELAESIRLYGVIQAISVTKQANGRYIILAGERRSRAVRQLRDSAATPEDKTRWSKIPASDRGPTANDQLAELALTENLLRDDLRPMETAEALADLRDARSLKTEQVAELLGLDLTKTKRLLQLASAPPAVRLALGKGLMVDVSDPDADAGAKPRREHRYLELSHALLVLRAYGFWNREKPKKAAELTTALVEKVLTELWPHRRLKDYVDNLVDKKPPAAEAASETGQGEAPTATSRKGLFLRDDRKLVISHSRLAEASSEERAELKTMLTELLKQL